MRGHVCEGLGREGVMELFRALFRWWGVLNASGLGSCGILVELRIGLRGCLLATGMLMLSIICFFFGSVTLIKTATKNLY